MMSTDRRLNVAMLGTKFMGRAHAHAWRTAGRFFDLPAEPGLRIVAGRDAEATRAFADRWGWEEATTRWRTAVTHPEVDLVDVATPNDLHAEQAIAALEAGKHVACEKPWRARSTTPGRCATRPARPRARPSSGTTTAGSRPWRWPTAGPRGQARTDLPRPRRLPAGLGRPRRPLLWRFRRRSGRLRRARRPQRPHHRHGPVHHRRGGRRRSSARSSRPSSRSGRGPTTRAGRGGAPSTTPSCSSPASPEARSPASSRPDWPPASRTQPDRDPRREGRAPVQLRAHELAASLLRRDDPPPPAGLAHDHGDPRRRPSVRSATGGPTAMASATSTPSSTRWPTW